MTRTEAISQAIDLLQEYLDEDITPEKYDCILETLHGLMDANGMERRCKSCEQQVVFGCPNCGAIDE